LDKDRLSVVTADLERTEISSSRNDVIYCSYSERCGSSRENAEVMSVNLANVVMVYAERSPALSKRDVIFQRIIGFVRVQAGIDMLLNLNGKT
jgi:hypothetical protein